MATITVTNLNDNGPGSLRDAISTANDGDTITFAPNLAGGTLVLTSGELVATKNVTIEGDLDGNGTPDITISGNNASRVLDFGSATTATLDGLVIVNGSVGAGQAGGAVLGQSLTVSNSRLDDNSATGGIGGAIFASASLTLINSAVDENSAQIGGGVNVLGFLNIVNSTLSGNTATGDGGGVYETSGNLIVVNGTLSGNSASGDGGAIYARFGTTFLDDSTLTGNYGNTTGGVAVGSGHLRLSNSIVAGNYGQQQDDVAGHLGTDIYFKGNNILGSSPVADAPGTIDTSNGTYLQIDGRDAGMLQTVFASVGNDPNTNVLSGVLGNNGGPVQTVAIMPGGIANDTGDNAALPPDTFDLDNNGNTTTEALPVDARGLTRVADGTVDIGAFEQQSFVVTTLQDETYDGGRLAQETADGTGLSLREALGLAASSGAPCTITFAPNLAHGTIYLANGALDITSNVTIDGDIDGNGTPDIAIDAGGSSRVINDAAGSNVSATLNGLVLEHGYVRADFGGGIAVGVNDTLTVSNSLLYGNTAGYVGIVSGGSGGAISVAVGGSLTLLNSTLYGNSAYLVGGGIFGAGFSTVNVVNSTLLDNSAADGGGLYTSGAANIANSTLSGNTANGGGGVTSSGTLTLVNTTLSGNSAYLGGAILDSGGTANLYDSTVTGNRGYQVGGVEASLGSLTLSNSIVAGNSGHLANDVAGFGASIVFKGNNILGSSPDDALGGSIDTTNGTYTQIDGTSQAGLATVFARVGQNPNTNVLSGALADNGGLLPTVAINPTGIAHNAGYNAALPPDALDLNNNGNTAEPLPVDARGFPRVYGGSVDIGAFEQQQGATFLVTTLADNPYDGGTLAQELAEGHGLSLRQAIGLANQDPTTADTILFDPSLIGGSTHGVNDGVLLLTNGQLTVDGNVTIEGDITGGGTPQITIDGQGISRDLDITGGRVTLDGLTITGGYAFVHGGGVSLGTGAYAPANVTISHSVITNNQAAYGGGISINPGDALALTNSVISGNSAFYGGGGIASYGLLALRDTTVSGNTAGYGGGGIANYGALLAVNTTISNNQITNGSPDALGGGLYNAGFAALANTTIASNKGGHAGGGIYNKNALQLTNVTIANNSAYNGGGLYNAPCGCGNATIYDSTFTGNNAQQLGGGIYNANGTVTLTNAIVAGNRAGSQGSDVLTEPLATTNYAGVNLFSQTGIGRPGIDITQPDLTQIFANTGIVDPDGVPNSGDEFEAGALTNNGGSIQTVRIRVGGSAQDTGSTTDLPPDNFDLNNNGNTSEPLPVDARGLPRVFGPAVDVGAFEVQGPVLTNVPASAGYTENTPPVELSVAFGNPSALTVTDVGATALTGATVTITAGALATDALAADTAGTGITASYDPTTATLTLSGTDTLADYSQVLDSVTFSSPGAHPDNFGLNPTRTVTWSVTDIAGVTSAPATTTIAITAIPSVPFDLNGDAVSDLAFQNNGTPQIWLWNGTSVTSQATFANPGASWHIIASRDVNGDGKADLIWQNSDGTPGIWLMNGTTPIAEAGLANPGPAWKLMGSGDFNDDGRADLLWQDVSGNLGVWEMNGTTPIAEAGIGNPGPNWKVVGAADFNADGRDDILLQNTATGNLMIDLMNGTSITSSASITVGDPSWHAVSVGEFNGRAEIAWQNSNGTPGLWLMNGTSPAAAVGLPNPGAGWQLVSIDHFTPNGQADLLFQNTSGAMGLWETNGAGIASSLNLPNPGAGWQSVNGHPFATG